MKILGYEIKRHSPPAAVEARSSVENPSIPLSQATQELYDAFGATPSDSGISVNEETALRFSAVWSAVRILSESVATLPLHLYRRTQRGKEKAVDHPVYWLLHDEPNEDQTSYYFRETKQAHVTLHGNAYSFIEYQRNGIPRELITLPPGSTWAQRKNGFVNYKSVINGVEHTFFKDQILHIPALGFDGLMGKSPIRVAREAIGLGLAAQQFGASFFANGARLSGVLEHPGKLSKEAKDSLKASFSNNYQGNGKTGKVGVLEEGMKFNMLSIPPEDAQYLETRKFQVTDIARIYRIPPHMLADLERSTNNNIEHQGIEFVVHTLMPWLVRWEQELNRKLLRPEERKKYFFKFQVAGLLRGDTKTRYEAYKMGRDGGWLSVNDIREMDDMDLIEGGNVYLQPLNMQDSGKQKDKKDDQQDKRYLSIADRVAQRYGRKQAAAIKKMADRKDGIESLVDFYGKLSGEIERDLNLSSEDAVAYCERMLAEARTLKTDFDVEVVAESFATDLLLLVSRGTKDGN